MYISPIFLWSTVVSHSRMTPDRGRLSCTGAVSSTPPTVWVVLTLDPSLAIGSKKTLIKPAFVTGRDFSRAETQRAGFSPCAPVDRLIRASLTKLSQIRGHRIQLVL